MCTEQPACQGGTFESSPHPSVALQSANKTASRFVVVGVLNNRRRIHKIKLTVWADQFFSQRSTLRPAAAVNPELQLQQAAPHVATCESEEAAGIVWRQLEVFSQTHQLQITTHIHLQNKKRQYFFKILLRWSPHYFTVQELRKWMSFLCVFEINCSCRHAWCCVNVTYWWWSFESYFIQVAAKSLFEWGI